MPIDITQFHQVFFEEATEHLAAMETLLLGLDVHDPDPEELNAIFRAAHSIKGSSGTFGFTDIAEVTHVLESQFDQIRKGQLPLRADMIDAFLETGDRLRALLAAHRGRDAAAPAARKCLDIQFVPTAASARDQAVARFVADLRLLGEVDILTQPEDTADAVGFWQIRLLNPSARTDFADQLDSIAGPGAWRVHEVDTAADHSAGAFGLFADAPGAPDEVRGNTSFEPLPASELAIPDGEAYGFFEPLPTPAALTAGTLESGAPAVNARAHGAKSQKGQGGGGDSSIRVGIDKVDRLIDLVGELVITQSMLLQAAAAMQADAPGHLLDGLAQLERNTRDLREAVISIRMLPVSFVFSRFPRVVHDLSSKLGKQVELETFGEDTELDKGLIEHIVDPLTHLIRNSLDHGIEKPEQRVAAGKHPVGTITLKACHLGGNIVIEVGDDGVGLDRGKILAKAREKGFAVAEEMSDQEVFGLVFEAGFSTAEQVTDISGRGVGMDVVRKNIQALGGRVEIESMVGIGTRTTVRLPLTLAILEGLSVAVGDQTYILPLAAVSESLQPAAADIKTLSNQARVVQVRGDYLPVVVLAEVFNLQSRWCDYTQGIMVVLNAGGARVALFVDELLGGHQVVVKSLESNYRRVHGVSGATIMGDGSVALILDAAALAGLARNHMGKAA